MSADEPLWASLPVPALVIDAEERIARLNPAAEGFLLGSARTLVGEPVWDRLAIDAPLEAAFGRARASGAPLFINDVDVGTGTRPPVICNLQVAPLAGAPGHMLLLIAPRELAGRVGQNSTVKAAARSAIGMAEMLAHEIKNPLAGITGAAQLLSMTLGAEDRELTDLIVSESRRIVALLERVEQFGNMSAPALRAVNLHDVLDRARRSAMLGFAGEMRFVEDYDPSLPPALGDGDQLLQVVLNLLKNAAEAASIGQGTIRLRTFYDAALRVRREGGARSLPLHLEVIDDGPGLPTDIASDVFEPFVSGRENGTGLGLALAAKIISDHGGWISVESVPGRTVFRISLQRADAQGKEG
ncbi:two-component system sensor histidine kinase NtrB [Roseovarius autotrophicus]|uniref:two-component system sensor histidine kinase NtrB n=1 Tax=Roseovarius autotrophicus TaxID=2824121 RepID=UPI0019E81213|nr:ATP-binding protein [Roseovarius autotrophicus]MBE0454223.1 PAS domain-containing protein [Roseovarius sp.]